MPGLDPGIHFAAARWIAGSCVDGPRQARFFFTWLAWRPLAVMCPACWRGFEPQALMGTVDRDLIKPAGSRCPLTRQRSPSIRRLTDDAITCFHPRKPPGPSGAGRSGRRRRDPEALLADHQRPADTCHLVGQGNRRQLARLAFEQPDQPRVLLGSLAAQDRHRAIHQQPAQIAVAALADRAKFYLAARAVLSGHQAERRGEVSPAAEDT